MRQSRRSSLPRRAPTRGNSLAPVVARVLRERPPAARAELLHVLRLPDLERAERTGKFWSYPQSRTFAELLIDCEEDRVLRAVLVGMLREASR
jgi:hypothetical protein